MGNRKVRRNLFAKGIKYRGIFVEAAFVQAKKKLRVNPIGEPLQSTSEKMRTVTNEIFNTKGSRLHACE